MMSKQKKPILICAVIFAVLLAAYFIVIVPLVESGNEEEETDPLETISGEVVGVNDRYMMYPQVERSGMSSIRVENEYGTFEFYRDANNDFQIRGYEGTAYNLELFSQLVTSTGYTLSKVKVVDNASDAQLEEYGLLEPQANWTLTTLSGDSYKVYVGYDLLTGGGYYCMLEGRRSVYVLDVSLASVILAPIENLCSPVLLAGIAQDDYFTIDHFTMIQGDEVLFRITKVPVEEQNNPDALVENIMDYPAPYFPNDTVYMSAIYAYMGLTGSSVAKLGATEKDIENYGLADPAHTIYFEYQGSEIMLFFSELQADGTYYAMSTLFPHVISVINAADVAYLEYGLIDWIEEYPFQQWITRISKMTVDGSGADVSFSLTHGVDESGANTLDVKASNGLVIPNNDVYNFRQFYKTLLSIKILDYVPLSDEKIDALTADDSKCILTFTITDLEGEDMVYRFYPYSGAGRRCLMTVNGVGEFSVMTDLVEKVASDANKVLAGLDVNSYGKN